MLKKWVILQDDYARSDPGQALDQPGQAVEQPARLELIGGGLRAG